MKELLAKMKNLISQSIPVNENLLDTDSEDKIINILDGYRYGITMVFRVKNEQEIYHVVNYLNLNPDIKILNLLVEGSLARSEVSFNRIMENLELCKYLTSLEMSCGDQPFFVTQGFAVLALKKSLTSLGLPAKIDEKSIALLEKNTHLKTFKLCRYGHELQEGEVNEKIRIILNNPGIENLEFNNCSINDKVMHHFSNNRVLKSLNLIMNNNISDDGVAILSTHPTLTRLNLIGCNISNAGVAILMKNPLLRDLALGSHLIDDETTRLLSTHPGLIKLKLNADNKITNKGVGFLMKNLVLKDLYLGYNPLSEESFRLLSTHPTLTRLGLGGCRIDIPWGNDFFLQNTVLRSLDLSDFRPHNSARSILDSLLAHFFANHSTLTRLNLQGRCINDDGAMVLASNTRLTWLNLMDNPIGFLGAMALAFNETLKTLKISITDKKQLGWLFLLGNQNLKSLTIEYCSNDPFRSCPTDRYYHGLNGLNIRNTALHMERDKQFRNLLKVLPIPDVLTDIIHGYAKRSHSYPYNFSLFCHSLTPEIKKQINAKLPQIREEIKLFASTSI